MKRLLPLLLVPAVALAPGTALAHGKHKTKVYKGTFTLIGADGDYVTGNFGKVQLVDNKRNDKLSVHIRQVAAKTTYTFKLQADGVDVTAFKYKPLKTNRKGVANATARSRSFTAKRSVKYVVNVYAGTTLVLRAPLRTKHWPKPRGHGKPDKPHGKPDKPKGKSEDAPGQADDKTRGKSEDAPGQADDKTRGKSEDAPGQADDKPRGKSDDAPGRNKDKGKPKR